MWPAGQKTKQVHFWLSDEDVAAFSDALLHAVPALNWQCAHGGADPVVHVFSSLTRALECGDTNPVSRQAFAPLSLSALQFHVCRPQRLRDPKDGYAPDYVFPAEISVVRCGRMAIRWDSAGADAETLVRFTEGLGTIWKVFQRCTLPAKVNTLTGKSLSGFRIGQVMLEKVGDEGLYLQANGPICLAS